MFTFHTDPGHGWLEVPVQLLHELGIAKDISSFSFYFSGNAYLEEDCDAGKFLKAYSAARGGLPLVDEKYSNNTPIRHYQRYDRRAV
jgi:hypothetical protein